MKALGVGADAVAIGRSWVSGLAAAGQRGVGYITRLYRQEIEEKMWLMGVTRVADLDRSWVDYPAEWDRFGA